MAGIITLLIKTNVMLAALCLLYLALFRIYIYVHNPLRHSFKYAVVCRLSRCRQR